MRILCFIILFSIFAPNTGVVYAQTEAQRQIGAVAAEMTWYDFGSQYKSYQLSKLQGTAYYLVSMSSGDGNDDSYRACVVDGEGVVIVAPDAFVLSGLVTGDYFMQVLRKGDACYFIDAEGICEVDVSAYSELHPFVYGYAFVRLRESGLSGVIDRNGSLLFTSEYVRLYPVGDGFFVASDEAGDFSFDSSGYLLNSSGELVNRTYFDAVSSASDGMIRVSLNGKYGFLDLSGNEMIAPVFDLAAPFDSGVTIVRKDGKWGLIDKSGREITSLSYDDGYRLASGLYAVSLDGKYGVVNQEGELVLPFVYDSISCETFSPDDAALCFLVSKGDESLYLNDKGETIFSGGYSYLRLNPDGSVAVQKNLNGIHAAAFLDKSGKNLTGYKEFSLYYDNDSLIMGLKRGNYPPGATPPHDYAQRIAFFDSKGNNLTGFHYQNSGDSSGRFVVANRNYYGAAALLNQYGAEVLPPVFDDILLTSEGYAMFQLSDSETGENARVGYLKLPDHFSEINNIPPVTVYLNDIELYFDEEPAIVDGRAMAPMRKIFESLGCEIEWDDAAKSVTGRKGDTLLSLTIGDTMAYINGKECILDTAPMIQGDRTLVPLRFIAESTGADVRWDPEYKRVWITTAE